MMRGAGTHSLSSLHEASGADLLPGAQPGSWVPLGYRRLWSHGAFFTQVEDECVRAGLCRRVFGLCRVRPSKRRHFRRHLMAVLFDLVMPGEVLGEYAEGDYLLLLPGQEPEAVRRRLETLVFELEATCPGARVGVALYPEDGDAPATLLDVCNRRSHPYRSKGLAARPFPGGVYYQVVAARAAAGRKNVLISGESGTGKILVALAIHELDRGDRLVRVLRPPDLEALFDRQASEADLARTLGQSIRRGGGGTVVLRAVAELEPGTQRRLAAIMRSCRTDRSWSSLGLDRLRFIGTLRESPAQAVAGGRLLPELAERLGEFAITLPPLRERVGEILTLAANIIARPGARIGSSRPRLGGAVGQRLLEYHWPGNYIELRLALDRALALGRNRLEAEHLPSGGSFTAWPAYRLIFDDRLRGPPAVAVPSVFPPPLAVRVRPTSERERILGVLEASGWNQSRAAKLLAISRRTLLNRLDVLGISRPVKRP